MASALDVETEHFQHTLWMGHSRKEIKTCNKCISCEYSCSALGGVHWTIFQFDTFICLSPISTIMMRRHWYYLRNQNIHNDCQSYGRELNGRLIYDFGHTNFPFASPMLLLFLIMMMIPCVSESDPAAHCKKTEHTS